MELLQDHKAELLVVRLKGELDLSNTGHCKKELERVLKREPEISTIIFNLAEIDFIDSTGIGMILQKIRQMESRGGEIILTNLDGHLKNILQMAGVLRLVSVFSTEKAAWNLYRREVK